MKNQVTKFNLQAAFKALDELEIPNVGGLKPNKDNHKELVESMRPTPKTDCLLEDYYDVNNQEDLGVAQADRAEEVAQAKLAKIEKIVDLDAETPEDVQPSYVGKTIVQCPQCMTLFYRDPIDIHVSEEDSSLVNVGEQCPNCNNDSGYTVIGKVAAEEPVVEETPVEESELDLNFEEPAAEEENNEEAPAEETGEEEFNLEPVEEPVEENEEENTEEEEKKEESFEPRSENILAEQVENALNEEIEIVDIYDGTGSHGNREVGKQYIERDEDLVKLAKANQDKEYHYHTDDNDFEVNMRGMNVKIPSNIKIIKEALKEDINADELTKKLKEHDEYIKVLQDEIKAEEEAVKNAKNDFIKKMHENNLASLKDALDKAIPEEVKAEAAIEELPTAEDAAEDMTKNEALKEETEKFPDENKHELVDTVDGIDIYHCKNCGKFGTKINGKVIKKDSVEEIKDCIAGKCNEEICARCGKDVEDPCETQREAEYCRNNLEEAEMHIMDKKEFEAAAKEAGIKKHVHESVNEDVIAKDAPEEAKDIKQEQRKVSEIHKGKTEHVPGAIVEESLTEAEISDTDIEKMLDSKEFKTPISDAEAEALLADEPVEESCTKKFFESVEEISDEAIEKCITESLTNVYENVDSFKLTDCELCENKLSIYGDIKFKSGNTKPTTYVFTEAEVNERSFKLSGLNESFDKTGTFTLNGILEANGSVLIAEGFSYNYHIDNILIEGFIDRD